MSGLITKTEVEANSAWIIATWGRDFFEICLRSEGTTFLALLVQHGKI